MGDFYYLYCQKFVPLKEKKVAEFVLRDRSTVNVKTTRLIEQMPFNKQIESRYNDFEIKCSEYLKIKTPASKSSFEKAKNHLSYHQRMLSFFEGQVQTFESKLNKTESSFV